MVLAALTLTVFTLGAAPPVPPARLKVAVLALKSGPGVDAKTVDLLSDTFVATLQQRRSFQILSSKDIELALGIERQRQLLGCTGSSCMAEFGDALGADYLVSGTLGRLGSSLVFNIEALNLHTSHVEQRYSQRLKAGTEEAVLDQLGPAVDALFPMGGSDGGAGADTPPTPSGTPTPTPPTPSAAAPDSGAPGPDGGISRPPLALKAALQGQHPRLAFAAADVAGIRKRTASADFKGEWHAVLAFAEEHAAEAPDLKDAREVAILAFTALVTQKPAHLERARKRVAAVAALDAWPGDGDVEGANFAVSLAEAYDWLFTSLSPQERAAVRGALQRHGRLLYERGSGSSAWAAPWAGTRGVHCFAVLALVALAVVDELPEAQAWLDLARGRLEELAGHLGPDGADREGAVEAARAFWWLGQYADALERTTGSEDGFKVPWLRAHVRARALSLMPDRRSSLPFGDAGLQEREHVAAMLTRVSARFHDGLAAWLAEVERAGRGKHFRVFDFVWTTPVAATPPDSLPPSAVVPDLGLAVLRTGWDADAAVLAIKCGPPGGFRATREAAGLKEAAGYFSHGHPDASTFVLWQNHRWQVTLPGGDTRDKRTRSENAWLVSGRGQRGEATWLDPASYLGEVPEAHLLHAGASERADFAVCEAAPAYEKAAGLKSLRRTVTLARGPKPYAVILDRLGAQAPQAFSLFLHAQSAFELPAGPPRFRLAGPDGLNGALLSSAALHLDAHPLKVVDGKMQEVARGFELETEVTQRVKDTWLVTVLSEEGQEAKLVSGQGAPAVTVGTDRWTWDAQGLPSLDGQALPASLIK